MKIDGYTIPPDELPDPSDDRSGSILYTIWILLAVSGLVLAARLWTKVLKTHRLYYGVSAWNQLSEMMVLGLVHAVIITKAVHYGLGKHFFYIGNYDKNQAVHFGVLSLAWGNYLSPMAGRVAFCITMLYLTRTDPRVRRWPVWAFIVGQVVFNVAAVTFFYAQCGLHLNLLTDFLDYSLRHRYCLQPIYQTYFGYFVGSFNCLTDLFLTLIPAILIKHTRLSLRKKIGLSVLLCLSILALAAAIVKTFEARALSEVTDYTYDLCMYVIWVSIELNVVIIVASVPLLRPLFRRNGRPHNEEPAVRWDTTTLGSIFSRKGIGRSSTVRYSLSSEENIIAPQRKYEMTAMPSIQVTREVTVTYETDDAPFVHAALVGLAQGEIANPRLTRR